MCSFNVPAKRLLQDQAVHFSGGLISSSSSSRYGVSGEQQSWHCELQTRRPPIQRAIEAFDEALPDLPLLRNVGEHIDEYAVGERFRFFGQVAATSGGGLGWRDL